MKGEVFGFAKQGDVLGVPPSEAQGVGLSVPSPRALRCGLSTAIPCANTNLLPFT